MSIQYHNCLTLVNDIGISKEFYHKILGLQIIKEFDSFILFENGFAIHDASLYYSYIDKKNEDTSANYSAFYFTVSDIGSMYDNLKNYHIEVLHEIKMQEWGEKVLRFYDPDGHIIEIGESLS